MGESGTSGKILLSSRLKTCGGRRIVLEADFWRRRLRIGLRESRFAGHFADVAKRGQRMSPLVSGRAERPAGTLLLFWAHSFGPADGSGLAFWSEAYGPKFDKQFDK